MAGSCADICHYSRSSLPVRIDPSKMIDQHFLIDENIAKAAVNLCPIKKKDKVVEVGPGHGELTKFIPDCDLIVVEKDESLAKEIKKGKVIVGDGVAVLKKMDFDFLISSVPYSISEPLLRELILHEFRKAVLILPLKFVKQLGEKESSLSFLSNEFLEVKEVEMIPKDKFDPAPRVDSYLIEVTPKKGSEMMSQLCVQLTKKTKNALIEALSIVKNITRKEARRYLEGKNVSKKTLEKTVRMLSYHELKWIKENIV